MRKTLGKNFVFLVLFSLMAGSFAHAQEQQETQERLNQLEQEIEESKQKRQQLTNQAQEEESFLGQLSNELVLRAERSKIQQNLLNSIEENINELNDNIATITDGLTEKRARLSELLSALERLSQHPPELVFLRPNESLDVIRSASLLSHILPAIRAEAEKLKLEMTELEQAKLALSQEREKEQTALVLLMNAQDEMNILVRQRQVIYKGLIKEASETDKYIAGLVEEAETLEALLERLESDRLSGQGASRPEFKVPENYPTNQPITSAKGKLAFPVHGVITANYNSQNEAGRLKGIRVKAKENSQVLAPYDGQVVFSGEFRNYGQLLIIDHGEGYHSLLAGLNDLYGTVGQWVLTGEPVGQISPQQETDTLLTNNNNNELYIELRHNGKPINPRTWLIAP